MSNTNNNNKKQNQIFEPFPKPNTIPEGWDMSEINRQSTNPSTSQNGNDKTKDSYYR